MEFRDFAHKGLKRLYLEDNPKGLPADAVGKLRAMMTFLQDMKDEMELHAFPRWKAHQLTGDRKGTWSLHVTRNWRLTFRIRDREIVALNFEDYH